MSKQVIVFTSSFPDKKRADRILFVDAIKQLKNFSFFPNIPSLKLWNPILPLFTATITLFNVSGITLIFSLELKLILPIICSPDLEIGYHTPKPLEGGLKVFHSLCRDLVGCRQKTGII